MAHYGLVPRSLARTHPVRETLGAASHAAGTLAPLLLAGSTGAPIYGWVSTLAVYGFSYRVRPGRHRIPCPPATSRQAWCGVVLAGAAAATMLAAMVDTVYPSTAPYRYLPYLYLAYLAADMLRYAAQRRRHAASTNSLS